jgi:acyl-CoA synthetase (AMP-forming)/AMP-acid ligase II
MVTVPVESTVERSLSQVSLLPTLKVTSLGDVVAVLNYLGGCNVLCTKCKLKFVRKQNNQWQATCVPCTPKFGTFTDVKPESVMDRAMLKAVLEFAGIEEEP